MDFQLTDEQKAFQTLARNFTTKEIIPVAAEYDEREEIPWPIIRKANEIGFWNMNVPEQYGGQGLDHLTEIIVLEELAYGCLGTYGAFGGSSLALTPILLAGTDQQKQEFLPWFCAKPRLAAFSLTEPNAGSDVANISTKAERVGDHYVLNGAKCFTTHGGVAELYTIFATVDKSKGVKGMTAFLVPSDTQGLAGGKKEKKMGDRASHVGEVVLDNVKVPLGNRLGNEGDGFKIAMKTLDITRPGIAAGALGLARRALEEAVRYAKQRVQFGQQIGQFEGIQFMLADMAMAVESARGLVWRAAWEIDQGCPNSMISAMAKCVASDTAMKVAVDAVQVFGGYGYMREYPVEKLMRDAKITQIYEGTNQIQRLVIAKELLK